jgi:uncharacterized protein with NAD-binding domain and iron-sulfur cluster
VAVLGGGVAGLTAAHELAERGFDVTVFEAKGRFGGKARSMPGPDRGEGPPLPGEHGFRFFPGFYRHLDDTMGRIPYGRGTVADNLVAATQVLQGRIGDPPRTVAVASPESLAEWRDALLSVFGEAGVPTDETAYFVNRLLYVLTACRRRREEELERRDWWTFVDAENMSEAYRKYLGYGLTQTMVAMRPQVSSARTIGRIYLQLIRGRFDPAMEADRVLNAPTSDAWVDPWLGHLDDLGVDLRPGAPVERIHADGRRVTGVTAGGEDVRADYYVAALPLEVLRDLRTRELARTAPSLRALDELETAWMAGIQYYLAEDVDDVHGHGIYYDAPWALTSVAPAQFWSEYDLEARGAGDVSGVLSVILSEWDEPGILYDKPARECSPTEIRDEVWAQLKAHRNREGEVVLRDENVVDWFLDPELSFDGDGVDNAAPLLINTVDSLQYRPEAATDADNLVLAADYVRTNTDLASMEAANEAARRAVNAVLESEGIRSEDCPVWDLAEPRVVRALQAQDRVNYRLGLAHPAEAADPLWDAYRDLSGDDRGGGGGLTGLFQ